MKLAQHTIEERASRIIRTNDNPTLLESIRHRSCCVKLRYDTSQDAEDAMGRLELLIDNEPLRFYYCVFCNDFHLGRSGSGGSHTAKILEKIDLILTFDFKAGCSICGNFNRFNGRSRAGRGTKKPKPETLVVE